MPGTAGAGGALRSPCLSVLASEPGLGLPANWRDCISPGGEAGRPSLAPCHSVKTPVASEPAHAWAAHVLRAAWSFFVASTFMGITAAS